MTGASDGIGLGFAKDLAHRGFNIILHGRNKQKLEGVAEQLAEAYPKMQTRIYIANASSLEGDGYFRDLLDPIKDLYVTVLVNNVGGIPSPVKTFAYLQDTTPEKIDAIFNLNAGFTTKITRAVIPTLIKNEPSAILNLGSAASLGLPMLSIYGSAKAYLMTLSECLQNEFIKQGKDVTVHGLMVGSVATNLNGLPPSFFTPTSEVMAKSTLRRAGKAPVVMSGFWRHGLQAIALTIWPQWIRQRLSITILKQLEG